jgi:hypothetical protein
MGNKEIIKEGKKVGRFINIRLRDIVCIRFIEIILLFASVGCQS